jgi:hypothetical protein
LLATENLPFGGLVQPLVFIAGPGNTFALNDINDSEIVVFSR